VSQVVDVREPRATPRDSVGGGASAMIISRLVVAAAGWTGSLVIARQLSTSAWGGYSFIFGVLGIIGLLVDLQVGRVVLRQVLDPHEDAGRVVGSYVTLRFVISVVAYGAAVAFVVAGGYESQVVAGTAVAGLSFLFAGTGNGLALWFHARLWLRPGAVFAVLAAVSQVTLILVLALGNEASIVKFGATAVVSDAVIVAGRWIWLRKYHLHLHLVVEPGRWWAWIKESIPLAIGFGLVTLYYKVDVVMLGQFDTLASVGRYGIGYKFADVVSFIPLALMTPVMTLMVAAWPHDRDSVRRHYRQSFLLLFIAAVVISAGFALVAQPAVVSIYGDRYASSAWAARFLVGGATLQFFSYLCFITMISIGRRAPYVVAGILGLGLNIALNFALIPAFSFNGSAIATVITEVVVVIYLLVALRETPGIVSVPWAAMVRTVAAGAAMTGVYLAVARIVPWPGAVVAAGVTFVGVLHLLGADGPGGLPTLLRNARFEQDTESAEDVLIERAPGEPVPPAPVPPERVAETGLIARPHRGRLRPRLSPTVFVAVAVNGLLGLVLLRGGDAVPLVLGGVLVLPALALLGVAVFRRPQLGILSLALLLPLDGLRAIVPFPAGWKEALALVILAATFVAPAEARGPADRRLPTWSFVVAAFVGLAILSAVLVGGSQGLVGLKVEFFWVLVAVAIWRCPLDAGERDRLVSILMAMGVVTAVVGIVQQILGHPRLAELGWEYNTNIRFTRGYLRSFSTFDTNFPFALFLMLVILIGLPCALSAPRRLRNRVFLLSLPVLLLALVVTITRGAWLGLAVGLAYLGFTRFRILAIGLVHALVFALVALLFLGSYGSAFLSQSSSEERSDVWRQNVAEIGRHPLGVGIGASGGAATKVLEVEGDEKARAFEPDNQYFKSAFEFGIVGLWLFVLLLVSTFTATHAAARRSPGPDGALMSGVAASILAAAVISAVASYFEIFPIDAYFWLLLSVVAACSPQPVHASR
jgi:O-antigen/teichoic acid export membrane protein